MNASSASPCLLVKLIPSPVPARGSGGETVAYFDFVVLLRFPVAPETLSSTPQCTLYNKRIYNVYPIPTTEI